MYGYDPAEALTFKAVPNTGIFYVPKTEIDLVEFVQRPLPKAPQPLTLTSHWLAIEGVQPMIPENLNVPEPANVLERATVPGLLPREMQEGAEIKPLVKHILSKELQSYYDAVIADLMSANAERINAALYSVATDSGLQQLLPYFIQHVADMIPKNLSSLPLLQIFVGLVSSLLANEHLFIEPYVLSCMHVCSDLISLCSCTS